MAWIDCGLDGVDFCTGILEASCGEWEGRKLRLEQDKC